MEVRELIHTYMNEGGSEGGGEDGSAACVGRSHGMRTSYRIMDIDFMKEAARAMHRKLGRRTGDVAAIILTYVFNKPFFFRHESGWIQVPLNVARWLTFRTDDCIADNTSSTWIANNSIVWSNLLGNFEYECRVKDGNIHHANVVFFAPPSPVRRYEVRMQNTMPTD